eukprot:335859-Pyramimonas_sp.AAC.3
MHRGDDDHLTSGRRFGETRCAKDERRAANIADASEISQWVSPHGEPPRAPLFRETTLSGTPCSAGKWPRRLHCGVVLCVAAATAQR